MGVVQMIFKKSSRPRLYTVIVLAMALSLSVIISCSPGNPSLDNVSGELPIKIGLIFPQTGNVAVAGEFMRTGAVLAVGNINKAGGIKGRPLELVFEDDACDAKNAVTSFQKLAEVDRVSAVIGPFCSGSALATAPIADSRGVVELTSGAATPLLTKSGDFVFRVSPSDDFQAMFLADEVAERYNKIAVLYLQNQQATDMKDVFVRSFKGDISAIESFTDSDSDIRSQLRKLASSDPQAIVVLVFPAQFSMVTKQLDELGIDLPLYASHTFETPESLKLGKEAEKYIYSIQSYDPSYPAAKAFIGDYSARFNSTPSVWSAYTYDAVGLVADAISACGEDASCIKGWLYGVKGREGVTGSISIDKYGDRIESAYQLKTVSDGKFVPLIGG